MEWRYKMPVIKKKRLLWGIDWNIQFDHETEFRQRQAEATLGVPLVEIIFTWEWHNEMVLSVMNEGRLRSKQESILHFFHVLNDGLCMQLNEFSGR
jgi:hypothetical protein